MFHNVLGEKVSKTRYREMLAVARNRRELIAAGRRNVMKLKLVFSLTAVLALCSLPLLAASPGAVDTIDNSSSGNTVPTFDKVWSVALNRFNQSFQFAESVAELSNGNLVAVGGDGGNQANACKAMLGGAWMISTNLSGGGIFQRLSATCVTDASQLWKTIRPTADGGGISIGEDDANPLCFFCAIVAKSDSHGNLIFAEDLTSFAASGLGGITPTSDGGSITAGSGQAVLTQPNSGLILKLSPTGGPEWGQLFTETAQSFPGAVVNNGGGLVLSTVNPTPDNGYIVSGVADAHFATGFAHVLTIIKLNSSQGVDWAKVYYSSNWGSWGAGGSRYSVFPTADGKGYIVSGTLQSVASQFSFPSLYFLMLLDLQGNIIWEKGYGDGVSRADGTVMVPTADSGYLLGGYTNQFGGGKGGGVGEYDGWLIKTDANGNISFQNRYFQGEPVGSNDNVINDAIQTKDGGFAVAGNSYTGSLEFGGPGFWLFKTDPQGISSKCCQATTNTSLQTIDLQAFNAVYTQAAVAATFMPIGLKTKMTSVTPKSFR